jgi:hypothetical protein
MANEPAIAKKVKQLTEMKRLAPAFYLMEFSSGAIIDFYELIYNILLI